MSDPPLVGVLGATGAVGATATARLAAHGFRLRVGGRRPDALAELAARLDGATSLEVVPTDLADAEALASFCLGCALVAGCAGPTYLVLDRVARAAWAAGADYVDIGGELAACDEITGAGRSGRPPAPQLAERTAVFSCGVMPGLSGLLPRMLSADRALRRLDIYVGGAAVFTPLSAVDALLTRGERFGAQLSSLRNGQVVTSALAPLRGVDLPGFPVPMHAWPYLTTEAQALGATAGIAEVRSYNAFVSDRLPTALATAWALLPEDAGPVELAAHAQSVVEASELDRGDHGQFYVMLFTSRPVPGERPGPSRLVLRATDSYALSGWVVARAARTVLGGGVPPGAHLASQVLDPLATVEGLANDPLVDSLVVV